MGSKHGSLRKGSFGALLSGLVVLAIAAVALAGWATGRHLLASMGDSFVPMAPDTALSFIILGLSLVLLSTCRQSYFRPIRYSAFLVASIATLRLVESVSSIDLNVDRWLFRFPLDWFGPKQAGYMAVTSAACSLCISTSLFLTTMSGRKANAGDIADTLAIVASSIGLGIVLVYALGAPMHYSRTTIPMALNTAVAFCVLGGGVLIVPTLQDSIVLSALKGQRLVVPIDRKILGGFGLVLGLVLSLSTVSYQTICQFLEPSRPVIASVTRALIAPSLLLVSIMAVLTVTYFAVRRELAQGHRIEADGRKAKIFLDSIIENVPAMIFVKDVRELRFIRFNKAGEEILGFSREEMIGKNDYDLFPKEQADLFTAKDRDLLAGNSVVDIPEEPIQTKHKELRFIHTRKIALKDDQGDSTHIIGISEDITQHKLAEETIRESEEKFRNVFEHSPIGNSLTTCDGTVRVNNEFCALVGYSEEELSTIDWRDITHPDDIDESQRVLSTLIAGENDHARYQKRYIHKSGKIVWADVSAFLQKDKKGKPLFIVTSNNDITERKRAYEALELVNTQLETANKELESFSYSVSHDLRAPLRSIDGFSQALLKDYNDNLDETGKDFLRRVRAASQKMANLIDDLLKLSRIARSEMHRERVNLTMVARETAEELQKTQPARRVEFIIADGVTAYGDPHLLRVGMENLLGNSWKFTGKNPAARIEFGATHGDGRAVYYIRDNGVGFDMAYADKLFGAFQRLHPNSEFEGTGIGLATVQRIIHRHNGRVWAEGKINEGATFYFSL